MKLTITIEELKEQSLPIKVGETVSAGKHQFKVDKIQQKDSSKDQFEIYCSKITI